MPYSELTRTILQCCFEVINYLKASSLLVWAFGEFWESEIGIQKTNHPNHSLLEAKIEAILPFPPKDYAGTWPPQKSYEKTIAGKELFAFCWHSEKFGKKMYIKFALKENRYYYLSLHKSKEKL